MTQKMSRAGPVAVGSRDKEVKAEVEVEEMVWVNKWISMLVSACLPIAVVRLK